MNLAPYIVGSVLAAGLGLGWMTAQVGATSGAATPANIDLSAVRHGGALAANAVNRLQTLDIIPLSDPGMAAETPPPPPDIAELFRRDLTAIEAGADGLTIWVVDDMSPALRRRIKRGELYKDGWVVSAITDQTVELRRRRERRQVAVFTPAGTVNEP